MGKYGVFANIVTTRQPPDASKIDSAHNSQQMRDILLPYVRDIVKANEDYNSMLHELNELHEYIMQFTPLQSEYVELVELSCLKTISKEYENALAKQ